MVVKKGIKRAENCMYKVDMFYMEFPFYKKFNKCI